MGVAVETDIQRFRRAVGIVPAVDVAKTGPAGIERAAQFIRTTLPVTADTGAVQTTGDILSQR